MVGSEQTIKIMKSWYGWVRRDLKDYEIMVCLGLVGLEGSMKITESWNALLRFIWVGRVLEGHRGMEWLDQMGP